MLKATDFTYDGVLSSIYGLKIASLDNNTMDNYTYPSPTLTFSKPPKAKKFYLQEMTYDNPPTYEFSILSETEIPAIFQREILNWLDSKNNFKELKIHQYDLEEYTYKCIFTIASIVYHGGSCVGFNIKATFDSNYMYGNLIKKRIVGNGSEQTIRVTNNTDIIENYVYPKVKFTYNKGNYFGEDDLRFISIKNTSDNDRTFEFCDEEIELQDIGETNITVDNELKKITSEPKDVNLLSKFNKNWFRLKHGTNTLVVKINGTIEISFQNYAKIRF